MVPTGIDLTLNDVTDMTNVTTDYDVAVADVDGDGYAEIIVIGTTLDDTTGATHPGSMWIFDDAKHGYAPLVSTTLPGDLNSQLVAMGMVKAKVAAGSMKSDRSVQIVVAWYDLASLQNMFASDNALGNGVNDGIGAVSFALYGYEPTQKAVKQIGDNQKTATNLISDWYSVCGASAINLDFFNIALANVAGHTGSDGSLTQTKQLVFAGVNSSWQYSKWAPTQWFSVTVFDDLDHADANSDLELLLVPTGEAWLPQFANGDCGSVGNACTELYSYPERFLFGFDMNGQGVDDLLVGPYTAHLGSGNALVYDPQIPVVAQGSSTPVATTDRAFAKQVWHQSVAAMAVGDVNGDLRDDVLVLYKSGQLQAWGQRDHMVSASGNPLQKNYRYECSGTTTLCTTDADCGATSTCVDAPDWVQYDESGTSTIASPQQCLLSVNYSLLGVNDDNDSTLVEYVGNPAVNPSTPDGGTPAVAHSLVYGDPKIIALLAAPPVTNGLGQNQGNDVTTFGTESGSTYTQGTDFSSHVGVILGAEFEVSTGLIVNVESFKFEVESQLTWTHNYSWSTSVTESVSDSAGDGDDLVIFSAQPYDRYTYLIATHPNPALIGSPLTVDVPQSSQVMAVTRATFNSMFPTGLQITTDLLQDTPYDLSSYPTQSQVPTTTTGPTMVNVGNGYQLASTTAPFGSSGPWNIGDTGYKNCSFDLSQSSTWQQGLDFSVDVTAKVTAGDITVGGEYGFSSGGYVERETSNSIEFASTVSGLPDDAFNPANKYSWGMYAYEQKLADASGKVAQDFFVVNYWTGAYGAAGAQ